MCVALEMLLEIARISLRSASVFLNDAVLGTFFGILLILAVSVLLKEEKKLPFLFSALLVALLLGLFFKPFLSEERPCASSPAKIPCPPDFALPSLHALIAFTLVVASLGNRSFPIYLLFSLFVSYTRVYLGVHTLLEVTAGLALAFFACVITELAWKAARLEIPRIIHIKHDAGKLQG